MTKEQWQAFGDAFDKQYAAQETLAESNGVCLRYLVKALIAIGIEIAGRDK